MPGRVKSKRFSATQESEFRMRVLDVLANSDEALTTDGIKNRDIVLSPLTGQKLSRILAYLIEMGFVRKAKSKSTGRMMYKAVSKMKEQGYETGENDVPVSCREYNGLEWDFEDNIYALVNKDEEEDEN